MNLSQPQTANTTPLVRSWYDMCTIKRESTHYSMHYSRGALCERDWQGYTEPGKRKMEVQPSAPQRGLEVGVVCANVCAAAQHAWSESPIPSNRIPNPTPASVHHPLALTFPAYRRHENASQLWLAHPV